MEQRRVDSKNQWYHETQSRQQAAEALALVPEAAFVADRLLLDLRLPADVVDDASRWLSHARTLAAALLPDEAEIARLNTFSVYERLSTALTVAQVCGIQRLCNHYAARLAPLPGPDSSRESNYRLAQITQFARQLAASPSVITAHSRQQLHDVGLTPPDIVVMTQIVGFTGWQARVLAAGQALLGLPVRWLPGMPVQDDAEAALFGCRACRWTADPDITAAAVVRPQAITDALQPLAPLLAWDLRQLTTFSQLLDSFPNHRAPILAALAVARINGSVNCFNALAAGCPDAHAAEAIRGTEPALRQWLLNNPDDAALIQAARMLTRAPDRFSADLFTPLVTADRSASQTFSLLAGAALSGWLNRLKMGLGDSEPVA